MSVQHWRFKAAFGGECPHCGEVITLALVEPHPRHAGFEVHTLRCEKCGPIKSIIVALRPNERPPSVPRWSGQAERVVAGGRAMEIARVRITDAGRRALAKDC
jgi:hypothetical protein